MIFREKESKKSFWKPLNLNCFDSIAIKSVFTGIITLEKTLIQANMRNVKYSTQRQTQIINTCSDSQTANQSETDVSVTGSRIWPL